VRLVRRLAAAALCLTLTLFGPAQFAHACQVDVDADCTIVDSGGGGGGGGGDGGGGGGNGPGSSDTPGAGSNFGEPCLNFDTGSGPPEPGGCDPTEVVVSNPAELAWLLVARVRLKPIKVGITPLAKGPRVMGLVGLPVWLWADDPTPTTWGPVTISAGAMSLTARVSSVTWDMGDGTKFSCGKGTGWKRGMVKADGSAYPSPTCGHTYSKQGRYTITATTHWNAHWTGYGESGDIPFPLTTTYRYTVAELQAIRVR